MITILFGMIMTERKYYKQLLPNLITYFCVENDNVTGMFREAKTNNNLSIMRDIDTSLWRNVSVNDLAKTLINQSEEIDEYEYETSKFIVDSFIDSEYSLITEDKMPITLAKKNEVVSETVFC